jgi:hypothetical protein
LESLVVNEIVDLQRAIEHFEPGLYTPVYLTGEYQMVLAKNGIPVSAYKVLGLRNSEEPILKYIEGFDDFRHLVMLYDDRELARKVEFEYIQLGLERREQCQYVIPEDDVETVASVKQQMEEFGIDTERYMREDCLRIVTIPDPAKTLEGFKAGCREILDSLLEEAKMPLRMVLHVRYQLNNENELQNHAEFERFIEDNFRNFPGSMLCNHYVGNYPASKPNETWTRRMLETHDTVFIVSSNPKPAYFKF